MVRDFVFRYFYYRGRRDFSSAAGRVVCELGVLCVFFIFMSKGFLSLAFGEFFRIVGYFCFLCIFEFRFEVVLG